MRRVLAALAVALTAAPCVRADVPDIEGLVRQYDYDAKKPPEVEQKELYRRDGATVYDVSYASPRGGRVTAYLVVPTGKGPFAGLVFGHWGPGNRTEFLPEAKLYARAGAVSLLVDYPWVRPAPWRKNLPPGLSINSSTGLITSLVVPG